MLKLSNPMITSKEINIDNIFPDIKLNDLEFGNESIKVVYTVPNYTSHDSNFGLLV